MPKSNFKHFPSTGSVILRSIATVAVHAGAHASFRLTSAVVTAVGALGLSTGGRQASLVAIFWMQIISLGPLRVLQFVLAIANENTKLFDPSTDHKLHNWSSTVPAQQILQCKLPRKSIGLGQHTRTQPPITTAYQETVHVGLKTYCASETIFFLFGIFHLCSP